MKAAPDMTVADCADHLGISTQRVYDLLRREVLTLAREQRPKLVSGPSIARRSYQPPGFISVPEAASILGVSRSTAYNYIESGRLTAVSPHPESSGRRRWLVSEHEVIALMEEAS